MIYYAVKKKLILKFIEIVSLSFFLTEVKLPTMNIASLSGKKANGRYLHTHDVSDTVYGIEKKKNINISKLFNYLSQSC
jgi:hypothetical protein